MLFFIYNLKQYLFRHSKQICFDFSTIFVIIQQEIAMESVSLANSKKSTIIMICSIILLLASIITLVIYFCLHDSNSKTNSLFSVSCSNITLNVGQSTKLPIIVSDEKALLSFEISDERVAKIENGFITALNPGQTLIKITATLDGKTANCNFYFTAIKDSYSLSIIPIVDCSFKNNVLEMSKTTCQFKISLLDKQGDEITNPVFTLSCSDGLTVEPLPFGYLLTASKNGYLNFDFETLDFAVSVSVVLV